MISNSECIRKKKITSFNCPNDDSEGTDSVRFSARSSSENLSVESFYDEVSPNGKLECLKNALKMKIKQMQTQDEVLQELECQLRKAKKDLAFLKDQFNGESHNSTEFGKREGKLKDYKEVLMRVAIHLEKVFGNMSGCKTCKECTCKQLIGEESRTIQCIKKDLESLKLKKFGENESELKDSKKAIKWKPLNANDAEDFRVKAVTGVATLEEIKEQIDILHGIIKNYYSKLPCEYEKGQIEECETKISNLHLEFDEITDGLCTMIESYNPAVQSDASDSCMTSRRNSSGNPISGSELTVKVNELKCEQKQLQREICDQEAKLNKIRNQIKEVELALDKKKVLFEEQEKDLKLRDREISNLRSGVKSFRERLKIMQIDIADNLDGTTLVPSNESCSSLSVLSVELQELCEILTSSQVNIPGIIEKCKEENYMMKKEINCLETCLRNKDESLAFLQQSLKMRESQVEDLNCKIQCLDAELEKVKKIVEEKNKLIGNLEDSVKKAKEFEMRIKDESIEELQTEVCDFDYKLKAMTKEVVKKEKELEIMQDEILYVSSKNFFLTRETDLLELKVGKLQKNLAVYEKMAGMLQKELNNRECENEQLYERVKELEQELEFELKKCEKKTEEDLRCINELNNTVKNLQSELDCARANTAKSSSAKSSRSGEKRNTNQTQENPCIKPDSNQLGRQLKTEGKISRNHSNQTEKECLSPKPANLGSAKKQTGNSQELCSDKINELKKVLEETVSNNECEKKKLVEKLCKEENENIKNKELISKLNEFIKKRTASENNLKCIINRLKNELGSIRCENENLKQEIEAIRERIKRHHSRGNFEEMDKLISDLEAQKSDLRIKCCSLKSELDKEEKIKRSLESKIACLNDSLANKTVQCNELFQNYKCESAKAEEALMKLKEAEDRLKCMKMEMKTFRVYDEDEEDDEDGQDQTAQKKRVEELLEAKKRECSDLIKEIDCLKVKLKSLQGEHISALAKDSELTRMNGEVGRLRGELELFEKENSQLKNDVRKAQDELKNRMKIEDDFKDEMDEKEKKLCEVLAEKKSLLKTIDDLHVRLEEVCFDNNRKEKENTELVDEYAKLKEELCNLESELCETRQDLNVVQNQYDEAVKAIKCTEKKMLNFKELYNRLNEENANLQETRSTMEKDLRQATAENLMLKEKMICTKRQKDVETKKLIAENSNAAQEKIRYCTKIKELTGMIKNLEEHVIPRLEDEITKKERCIQNYKLELQEANSSSQRMRDESLRVIQCTKKYLAAQKYANDGRKMRADYCESNRHYPINETKELEEQLKTVTRLNEHLYFELRNEKNDYQDIEPRSFSPLPWGCSNAERDNSSPEYGAESGFQSMQQSPTNYMHDYSLEGKRKSPQWKSNAGRLSDNNDYSPCRNNSVR